MRACSIGCERGSSSRAWVIFVSTHFLKYLGNNELLTKDSQMVRNHFQAKKESRKDKKGIHKIFIEQNSLELKRR